MTFSHSSAEMSLERLVSKVCSVVRCVAVWCSVVQCVAVCCSVLQCVSDDPPNHVCTPIQRESRSDIYPHT